VSAPAVERRILGSIGVSSRIRHPNITRRGGIVRDVRRARSAGAAACHE
jgi:hypothetical protein